MKKISIVLLCLMLMMPLSSLSVAEKTQTVDDLEKDYFSVYELADFGQSARGVTVADFNDDGWMDFAVSYSTRPFNYSTISIFYNTKNLDFTREDVYTFSYGYIDSLSAGDFDNDGDIDLIFSYSQTRFNGYVRGFIEMLSNDGTNHFEEKSLVSIRGLGFYFGFEKRIHPKITSADYDNDGDLDLLVGDNSGKLEFYKNNGRGGFRTQGIIFNYDVLSWGVASADFNNDDYLDVVVAAEDRRALGKIGHVFLKENTGLSNCFEKGLGSEIANPGGSSSMTALDYDNDGFMDIVTGSSLSLYMNWGGGFQRFYMGRLYDNEGNPDCLRDGGLAAADFNKDGWTDIVAGGVHGIVRLFINDYQQFPPTEPSISGKDYQLEPNKKYVYNFTIADMNKDDVYLLVEWEDGTQSDWLGPFESGTTITLDHTWEEEGVFTFRAKSKDVYGAESGWRNCTVGVESKEVVLQQLDGDTLYVDGDGTADYTSIQAAVDAAEEGDTIFVYDGAYNENLQIDKTISLIGEEKNNTLISGLGHGNVVNITADFVELDGFTVKNGFGTGIYVYAAQNIVVSNCIVTKNKRHGIHLDLAKQVEVSDCIISSNKDFGFCVVNLDGSRPGRNENTISQCIISNNSDGVFLDDISGTTVENNTIKNNRFYGAYLVFARDCEIKWNNFIDNTEHAFFQGGYLNSWNHNYWDKSWNFGLKIIIGKTWGLPIPWFNFDRNPASEQFDMGGK